MKDLWYYFVFVAMLTALVFLLDIVNSQDDYYNDFYRTRSGLTEVPDDIPDDASIVVLIDNKITTLRTNAFLNLFTCEGLYLQINHISHIEDGAFNGLVKLRALYLMENKITNLTSGTFKGLVVIDRYGIC